MSSILGSLLVILVYGPLMAFWWNFNALGGDRKLFSSSSARMISGLVAGSLMIPLSFLFYGFPVISGDVVWTLLIAIVCNVGVAYSYVAAARKGGAAIGPHVGVFGPIIALFAGKVILNEWPNTIALLGISITLIGVLVLHKDPQNPSLWGSLKKIIKEWRDWLVYAILLAIVSGIVVPFDKINIEHTNAMFAPGVTQLFGWGFTYLVIMLVEKRGKFGQIQLQEPEKLQISKNLSKIEEFFVKRKFLLLLLIGLCFGIANLSQGIAYTLLPTAVVVTTLKKSDALISVILVLFLFKCNRDKKPFRWIGAIVILFGLVLVGLSNLFLI